MTHDIRHWFVWTAAVLASAGGSGRLAAQSPAADPSAAAIGAALAKNVAHCREWLEQKDYKSVAQGAGSLQLLADLLQAQGDDAAWQAACVSVASAVGELPAAARSEDAAKISAALADCDKALAAAEKLAPAGKRRPLPRGPGIRPLMLTMDGIYADAKIGLLSGNVAAAKNQARVLAELAKPVSNSRTGEAWTKLAGDFSQAAQIAADSTETDPQKFRPVLRGISLRCEACHETRTMGR